MVAHGTTHLFDIPVYRRSRSAHKQHFETKRANLLLKAIEWGPDYYEKKRRELASTDPPDWYSWAFNDVVGWICIYTLGSQFRGDLYHRDGRWSLVRPRPFRRYDTVLTVNCQRHYDSAQVWESLITDLRDLARTPLFRNRQIWLQGLLNVGPSIDWVSLLARIAESRKEG